MVDSRLFPPFAMLVALATPPADAARQNRGVPLDQTALSQYARTVWTPRHGLPQASVLAIARTRDGYLWLGTGGGLVRFDGVRFTTFNRRNTPALRADTVLALVEDRAGALWIGTRGGGLVRLQDGEFTSLTAADGLPDATVLSAHEDRAGGLWIGTPQGLALLRSGVLASFPAQASLGPLTVRDITDDAHGNLWLATDTGLHRVSQDRVDRFTRQQGLPDDVLSCVLAARDGSVWAGARSGLVRVTGDRIEAFATAHGVPPGGVSALFEDDEGRLWIGATSGGLGRFASGAFTAPLAHDAGPYEVRALAGDREGNVWLGTDGAGLVRLRWGKLTPYGTPEGLSHDAVSALLQASDGSFWIGTADGLNHVVGDRVTVYTTADGLASSTITALYERPAGTLWVGTTRGLSRLQGGRLVDWGALGVAVRAIRADSSGTVWAGTERGLVALQGAAVRRYGPDQGLAEPSVLALHEDRAGALWIGTAGGGLFRLDNETLARFSEIDGVSGDTIQSFYEDATGALWIGTRGGLTRHVDGRFVAVTTGQGLHEDIVYAIVEDDVGGLWMRGARGVFRVGKTELEAVAAGRRDAVTAVAYDESDGMRSAAGRGGAQPGAWKSADGRVWFNSSQGAVAIDPGQMPVNAVLPPVVIEQVLVNRVPADLRPGASLAPGRGNLEFRYTALSFATPERVVFRYQLEGFDGDWVDAGPRRAAYYTNLPPGSYRFRVSARNEDGVWNEAGAAVSFSVQPRFSQTWAFYALWGLLATLLVAGVYRRRVRALRDREQGLVRLMAERTAALETANEQLRKLATIDGVTGIANHRMFQDFLRAEWRRAVREASPISLIMVDIDHFKDYNDQFGHQAGDECLRRVAEALARSVGRPGDLVARYGGEEFGVILARTDGEGAYRLAHKLVAAVDALALPHPASPVGPHLTVSIGVASVTPALDDLNWEELQIVAAADRALYRAKQTGRNRIAVYGEAGAA